MERVGTGIKRIKDSCLENNNKIEFDSSEKDFFEILKIEVGKRASKLKNVNEWLTQVNARIIW